MRVFRAQALRAAASLRLAGSTLGSGPRRRVLAKRLSLILAVSPATAATSAAQVVFYDDFEDDALLPHWIQPPTTDWEYNVSNSMLNVTSLLYPSSPKSPVNFAGMKALFSPQTDFRMDVRMGWEAGDAPTRLVMQVRGGASGGGILASFGYLFGGGFGLVPIIGAGSGAQLVTAPAPSPGIYDFTITRRASQFQFSFNGAPFASLSDDSGIPVTAVGLDFAGPYPGHFGSLHVDRVLVVPGAGAILIFAPSALVWTRRRRR